MSRGGSEPGYRRIVAWLGVAIAAASVMVMGVMAFLTHETNEAAEPRPARLEAALRVTEVPHARGGQRIDVTLHNVGGRRAVVTDARLRIVDVAVLPRCWAQPIGGAGGPDGAIDPGPDYEAILRPEHAAGDTIPVKDPIHSIDADSVDRFGIEVTVPERLTDVAGRRRWLAQLAVELVSGVDRRTPVELGEAIVAVPAPPMGLEHYWTTRLRSQEEIQVTFNGRFPFGAMPCWRANARKLRRLLDGSGVRSPRLRDVAAEVAAPWEQ